MAANVPTEPSADLRQLASSLWQMYVALTLEGFSEQQALIVIGQIIEAQMKGGSN
jgi:hypothetical protein